LDLEIRKATEGKRSLDDLMREAYERWSGDCGYTEDEFRALASEIAGKDMSEWLRRAVSSTEELPYEDAMAYVGLRFKAQTQPKKGEGNAADDPWLGATLGWIGADTKSDAGRIVIAKVPRETPAFDAGLNVDDEIIGIAGYRVRDLEGRLKRYKAGDKVELLIARRDELMRLEVKLGAKPAASWDIELVPDAPADVVARRDAWLAGSSAPKS
jgi:predicted metalloprotease with PDZ domain